MRDRGLDPAPLVGLADRSDAHCLLKKCNRKDDETKHGRHGSVKTEKSAGRVHKWIGNPEKAVGE
jgi:hypothetical protein